MRNPSVKRSRVSGHKTCKEFETPRRSPPGFHDDLKTEERLYSFPRSEAVIFWGFPALCTKFDESKPLGSKGLQS